jgi:hypothetical protein
LAVALADANPDENTGADVCSGGSGYQDHFDLQGP